VALKLKALWVLALRAFGAWTDDYASSMGAALSYHALFSIAPLLIVVIAVAGLVLGPDAVRGEIFAQLRGLFGDDAARAIEQLLRSAHRPTEGIIAALFSIVLLVVGATTVIVELQNDLDRIWHAPAQQGSGILSLLWSRLASFAMVLGIAFLLIVSLVVSAALAVLGRWWSAWFGGWEILAHVLDLVASFGFTTVLFAMIYKIVPRVRIQWHDVWVGAAVTALLFAVGKVLIGVYLGKSDVTSPFGAAGSLVLVMIWVYYSAQIFLIGAEFTWVYAHEYGSRRGMPPPNRERLDRPRKVPGS
jgi:membrane protein